MSGKRSVLTVSDGVAFDRVRDLFAGLEDEEIQACNVYVPGNWERGGFLIGEGEDLGVQSKLTV